AGIGALTLPILLLWKRDLKGLLFCAVSGLIFFILAGIPDLLLRGSFHHSLLAVTTYNIDHGHEYGNGSILFYPLLLLGMSFFPILITKDFNKAFLLSVLKKNTFSVLFIFFFVALHTYFPQKFERFLVPIIPLFLILLTPFIAHLLKHFKKYKIRLLCLFILNSTILTAAAFQPSQGNIIKMALFIDQHPKIEKIFNFESTIEWLPEKFISKNSQFKIIPISSNSLADIDPSLCENIIVINEFLYEQKKALLSAYDVKAKFGVNFIESLAYRFNKKNNIRRSPLIVLGCSEPR
ncbi:MAG: hypothetical protein L6Q37_13380, partial [Bdellovibrionaceae bacterium]|nr:hypothetical protein [Pseudobdellovibrionaceae bacterium]